MGRLDPVRWAAKARHDRPKTAGLTDWFPCSLAPARKGTYERYFTYGARSLGVQSGVESADAAGVLMGCLLLFDVLAQDVDWRTAAA